MSKKRIYIIDDNDLVRESLALLVELEPDLEVCGQATNTQQALAEIDTASPDLVLVDLRLNDGTGGVRLMEQLREAYTGLTVIAITGHADAAYREPALQAGARRFIDKKEAVTELVPAIREVLASPDAPASP